jgi:threonine dehydratase
MTPPSALDILEARRRLTARLAPTPLRTSAWLSATAGGPVLLKLESVQPSCSFKIRGAFNALLRLIEAHPEPSGRPVVVTASAGNHGRAIAFAAEALGLRTIVFTPASAPRTKRDAIRRHGAELRDEPATYDDAEQAARAHARACGGLYISPYNHPDVIAGAGTIGLEIAEECPEVRSVFVPLGGGGLGGGVGLALRAAAPQARIVGVEAAASPAFSTSLGRGAITAIDPGPTLADGLAGNLEPGSITFPLVQQVVDEIVTISEHELRTAMRAAAAEEHLIVEGAAAVAVAAIQYRRFETPAVAIVTGANVDVEKLAELLG